MSELKLKPGNHLFWIIQNFNRDSDNWQTSNYYLCASILEESSECLRHVGAFGFLSLDAAILALNKMKEEHSDVRFRLVRVTAHIKIEPELVEETYV
jgi:hypothetical protein